MNIPRENRERWLRDLWACAQYHQEKARETAPIDLIGVSASTNQGSDEHILHKVFWWAVQEAAIFLEMLNDAEDKETDESSSDS
tara:strand:- start:21797 stop:22048 length:252 start_codon:yes stop_codon:yes gene_type:complete